jgi:hypothetical protein
MLLTEADPKGLVRESYRIDGITLEECRSIFIDWALSLPATADVPESIRTLLADYGTADPDHPMGKVLQDGLTAAPEARRRGGRAARVAQV